MCIKIYILYWLRSDGWIALQCQLEYSPGEKFTIISHNHGTTIYYKSGSVSFIISLIHLYLLFNSMRSKNGNLAIVGQ